MSPTATDTDQQQCEEGSERETQLGLLTGVFTFMTAGSGVGLFMLSQRLTPTLEGLGIDGLWMDAGFFIAGVVTLWLVVTSKTRAPEREVIAVEG